MDVLQFNEICSKLSTAAKLMHTEWYAAVQQPFKQSLCGFHTHQFDGHVFIGVEVLPQSQLAEVAAADLFPNAKVGANHENPRVGPCAPAAMSSPAASRLWHPFPFLCFGLPSPLIKIHKLVIPWPLHGYTPAMQIRKAPKQLPGKV